MTDPKDLYLLKRRLSKSNTRLLWLLRKIGKWDFKNGYIGGVYYEYYYELDLYINHECKNLSKRGYLNIDKTIVSISLKGMFYLYLYEKDEALRKVINERKKKARYHERIKWRKKWSEKRK